MILFGVGAFTFNCFGHYEAMRNVFLAVVSWLHIVLREQKGSRHMQALNSDVMLKADMNVGPQNGGRLRAEKDCQRQRRPEGCQEGSNDEHMIHLYSWGVGETR